MILIKFHLKSLSLIGIWCANFKSNPKRHLMYNIGLVYKSGKTLVQRALWAKNDRKTGTIPNISTSISPPGVPRVSKNWERSSAIDFKAFGCNHEVSGELEAKNFKNLGIFEQIWLLLRGFWLLASLKLHGCTQTPWKRVLWVLRDFLTPLAPMGVW